MKRDQEKRKMYFPSLCLENFYFYGLGCLEIVGARESLNGRKNRARRKVKNGEKTQKSPWGQWLTRPVPNGRRRSFLFFMPYFSARLDFPLPPLSAPGSPRMVLSLNCFVLVWVIQALTGRSLFIST